MRKRLYKLRPESKTKDAIAFIEKNKPTIWELVKFFHYDKFSKNPAAAVNGILTNAKRQLKREGKVLAGIRHGDEFRYKVLDKPEEFLETASRNVNKVVGHYKKLLYEQGVLECDYPKHADTIRSMRLVLAQCQKDLASAELLFLNPSQENDQRALQSGSDTDRKHKARSKSAKKV